LWNACALALLALLAIATAVAPVRAQGLAVKVVVIVGPVGHLTPLFLRDAERGALAAEAAGAQVVRVYTPNATWPEVERAAEGASILVYMGHGNGWPSRYRDSLHPPTQNGFGLNPVAGADDERHQYFGEKFVDDLTLAPNAVVLLHRLCYASGHTEPGMAEGSRSDAIERVDNFAAGFIRAGAAAVVADAHMGPAYYVRALLGGQRTIEDIWRDSPLDRGHEFSAPSTRSPGFTLRLDPLAPTYGYRRSLVSRGGLRADTVRAGATGDPWAPLEPLPLYQPTLADLGLTFATPVLRAPPVAGSVTRLLLPLPRSQLRRVPEGIQVSLRWDPLLVEQSAAGIGAQPDSDIPAVTPPPSPADEPMDDPSSEPPHGLIGPLLPLPPIMAAEELGTVVDLGVARHRPRGLAVEATMPASSGLYRLTATLHTPDGIAYDVATQALLSAVFVRVTGPVAVAFGHAAEITAVAGTDFPLSVRVGNVGSVAWDAVYDAADQSAADPSRSDSEFPPSGLGPSRLVVTWVSVAGQSVPASTSVELSTETSVPEAEELVEAFLTAPREAGTYLLLLDVESPIHGPMSALGNTPALIRVTTLPHPEEVRTDETDEWRELVKPTEMPLFVRGWPDAAER
jgi:hypothetical protein